MDERGRRIGQNEAVFREINERVREVGEGFSSADELADFICECAQLTCAERVQMALAEYEHVRSDDRWFVLVPGHEEPEYERIVETQEGYVVVEKLPGGPAEAAEAEAS